jgi:hypothetical protein
MHSKNIGKHVHSFTRIPHNEFQISWGDITSFEVSNNLR